MAETAKKKLVIKKNIFLIFQELYFVKSWVFFALRSVHLDALSYQKLFWIIFKIFHHQGIFFFGGGGGVKKLPDMKKGQKIPKEKNLTRGQNGKRTWVVEVLSSYVVLLKTLYYLVQYGG